MTHFHDYFKFRNVSITRTSRSVFIRLGAAMLGAFVIFSLILPVAYGQGSHSGNSGDRKAQRPLRPRHRLRFRRERQPR